MHLSWVYVCVCHTLKCISSSPGHSQFFNDTHWEWPEDEANLRARIHEPECMMSFVNYTTVMCAHIPMVHVHVHVYHVQKGSSASASASACAHALAILSKNHPMQLKFPYTEHARP